MTLPKTKLLEELEELKSIEKNAKKHLQMAPKGKLRIANRKNKAVQFYHCDNIKNHNGRYIRKDEFKLAQELAQKSYDMKILSQIKMDIERIEKALELCDSKGVQGIYNDLPEIRKQLVNPYQKTDQQYIEEWTKQQLKKVSKVELGTGIYTEKGEEVRSKSEKILADKLYMKQIPYLYEVPLYLEGYGTIKPDFTVLNVKKRQTFYWEHFGLMDKEEYCEKAISKIELFQRNHIFQGKNLILTYETNIHPLNTKIVDKLIQEYL